MGSGEADMSSDQTSAVLRASRLPLVHSALRTVTAAYSEVKGRYPLLALIGGVAEVGVRQISQVAARQATPLLQSLEPQLGVANALALLGLERLERTFPILNQSAEEVAAHLKDALALTLDDVQLRVLDALERLERLAEAARTSARRVQESPLGRAASSGLDDVLSGLEEAAAHYLPLPPALRREWELKVQQYEDEDQDEEPGAWTRVRGLLLRLSLQLHHWLMELREQLRSAGGTLGDAADVVGLGRLLRHVQDLLRALARRVESVREAALGGVRSRAAALAELGPVRQVLAAPDQVQQLLRDLLELCRILLQLLISTTPLYHMLQQPSHQEVEQFLNQEDFLSEASPRWASSLFLKAMDGRPHPRRSLHLRTAPGPPNERRSSLREPPEAEAEAPPADGEGGPRRPSAAELLLTPLKQFVCQSQKALEYLSANATANAGQDAAAASR